MVDIQKDGQCASDKLFILSLILIMLKISIKFNMPDQIRVWMIKWKNQFKQSKYQKLCFQNTISMNSLLTKIQQAANLFQTHDFKKSLQLYDQCISTCKKNQESKSLLHNLISSKGALMSILGDQKGALDCLNQVLSQDPYNSQCLMRRSQVFKKKNKLNKALKDLKVLGMFSPDNLQIAAMKVEIQNLKLKCKQVNSSSESEQESQKSNSSLDMDEQQKLNFTNLKKIDRKSVSIMIKPNISRKSRVTISGDIAIEYDAPQDDQKDEKSSFASTNVSRENLKQKYIKTFRQIQLDDQQESKSGSQKQTPMPVIKVKVNTQNTGRTKSILKNRDSTIYVNVEAKKTQDKENKYGGRQSKMIDHLKDIDGKVISSAFSERSSHSIKEVEFRKSIFGMGNEVKVSQFNPNQNQSVNLKPKAGRKSCLKRPSFQAINQKQQPGQSSSQPRRSKFDRMSKLGIDGIVLKNKRKSIETANDGIKQKQDPTKNDSDSDEGSQHNIFGSNQFVISKEVRENLGLGEDSNEAKRTVNKPRMTGGKSILKKNSVLMKSTQKNKSKDLSPSPMKDLKKAKKSVMFTKVQ